MRQAHLETEADSQEPERALASGYHPAVARKVILDVEVNTELEVSRVTLVRNTSLFRAVSAHG